MPDADDIADDIAESATTPQSATVDGNSATARSIDEKIKAANYTAGIAARRNGVPGLTQYRLRPTYE